MHSLSHERYQGQSNGIFLCDSVHFTLFMRSLSQVEEFGEVEADRRGFRRWTDDEDMVLRNRVHVIKITDPKLVLLT